MFRDRPTSSPFPDAGRSRRRARRLPAKDTPPAAEVRRPNRPPHPGAVRRVRRRVLTVLYVALAVELMAAALASPALHVRRVRLEGIQGLEASEVALTLNAAALPTKTNWLRAPVRTLEQRLRALPWVQTAQVRRSLPDVIAAHIVLRTPRVIAQTSAGRFEVDAGGVPIRLAPAPPAAQEPLVVLDRSRAVRPGIPFNDDLLLATIQVYDSCRKMPMVRIAKIEVDQSDNICLNMQDGVTVQFGRTDALTAKLALLRRIYTREPDIAQRLVAINLSCPTWPACTPRVAQPSSSRPAQSLSIGPGAAAPDASGRGQTL